MTDKDFILTAAIVCKEKLMCTSQRNLLDSMGMASMEFDGISNFSSAIDRGLKFSLLLLFTEDEFFADKLFISNEIPVLLIVKEKKWSIGDIDICSISDYVDFSSSSEEWEFRIRRIMNISNLSTIAKKIRKNDGIMNIHDEKYVFKIKERKIYMRGKEIYLRPKEYDVAYLLFSYMGVVLKRCWLIETLWGGVGNSSRSLDVCIASIREKLELRAGNILELRSVYKQGYQLIDMSKHFVDLINSENDLSRIMRARWR